MKALWIASLAIALSSSVAAADPKKEIAKEFEKSQASIVKSCGCKVQFTFSRKLDFTTKNGSSLALNVYKVADLVADEARQWCKEGDDFKEKFCAQVNSVDVDEDRATGNPYTKALGKGAFRSFIATKTNVLSNAGGNWVKGFLREGKMPEHKPDRED